MSAGICSGRSEEPGIDLAPGIGDRVPGIHLVEGHVAVVGVDHHLHRVADVVDPGATGLRVGEEIGAGVGVPHPDQAAVVAEHYVGIAVVLEEGGDALHPLVKCPAIEDAGVGTQVVRDQQLQRSVAHAEDELPREAADVDTPGTRILGEDVLVAHGVVELLGRRLHQHEGVGHLAIVDLGPRDLERRLSPGRYVAHEQLGQALRAGLTHRAGDDPVAVGVGEMLIDPGLGLTGELGAVELPGGDEQLPVPVVDHIAVDVDVVEVVVGAYLLYLAVGP